MSELNLRELTRRLRTPNGVCGVEQQKPKIIYIYIYIYTYIYIYIHTYIHTYCASISLSLYVYIYIQVLREFAFRYSMSKKQSLGKGVTSKKKSTYIRSTYKREY